MSKLRISIITACYNSERTIEKTITSVREQNYSNYEYIIIDGNSKDNTLEIIKRNKDIISKFTSEQDGGIYDAWNKGIDISTGDYLFFLNSDDFLADNSVISDVVRYIEKNDYPDVVYAKLKCNDNTTNYYYIDGKETELKGFLYKMHYCTLSAFVSKKTYSTIGHFDLKYRISSDYDWAIKLFKTLRKSDIQFYDRLIIEFSVGGISNKKYKEAYAEISTIIENHFSKFDYIKHTFYIKWLFFLKSMIPYAHKTGMLNLWRKMKSFY